MLFYPAVFTQGERYIKKAPLCSKKLSKKCLNCYDYLVPNRRSPASPKPGTI